MYEVIVTEENLGRTIKVPRDAVIVMKIGEDAATGYGWSIEAIDFNRLQMVSSIFTFSANPPLGSKGYRTIRIRAKEKGPAEVILKHWNKDDENPSIDRRLTVKIQVE